MLGEGVKGITYDVPCIKGDNDTLCHIIQTKKVTRVTMYGFDKHQDVKDVNRFAEYMKKRRHTITKIFKERPWYMAFRLDNKEENFKRELSGMKQVYEMLIENTLAIFEFESFRFVGAKICFDNDAPMYATFTTKCDTTADNMHMNDKLLLQFITDTCDSVLTMQKHDYAHCDIKPNNIIYCKRDNRFKLIDWELGRFLDFNKTRVYHGTFYYSSPLAFYLSGFPFSIAKRVTYLKNLYHNPSWAKSKIFRLFYALMSYEFDMLYGVSKRTLFRKYKYQLDRHNVGMSIAYLVWKNNLNIDDYFPVIHKLISFTAQ